MAGYNYPNRSQYNCDWLPHDTPYDPRELLAARSSFRQSFEQNSSKAMLSLIKKSQFAIHGGQGTHGSFHNNYFTEIYQENVLIQSESRDVTGEVQPHDQGVHSDVFNSERSPVSNQQIRCVRRNNAAHVNAPSHELTRKRKIQENENDSECEPADGPSAKRCSIGDKDDKTTGSINQVEYPPDSECLNTQWICDYCCFTTKSNALMVSHLKSASHYTASLSRCVVKKSSSNPISILEPAKLREPSAFCKKLVALCPDANCLTVFQNVYQCSLHYVRTHDKPHCMNRYSLGTVLSDQEVLFYSNKECDCGKQFRTVSQSLGHWQTCIKSGKRDLMTSMPNSFTVFVCCNCDSFIGTLNKILTHIVVKCMKTRIGFRALRIKKSDKWSMLLPNSYAVHELTKEAEELTGISRSNSRVNETPKLLKQIKAVNSLKQQFHNFMKLRCTDYDKKIA